MIRNYTRLYITKEKKRMIQRKIVKKSNARKRKGAKREKQAGKRKKGTNRKIVNNLYNQ